MNYTHPGTFQNTMTVMTFGLLWNIKCFMVEERSYIEAKQIMTDFCFGCTNHLKTAENTFL